MTRIERFLAKAVSHGEGNCWTWTGFIDEKGYGRFRGDDGPTRAHRWSYEFYVGPIPEGWVIDHLCRVRNCVNPAHLECVTSAENTRRGAHSLTTHCPYGHPYDETNTKVIASGSRWCRPCGRRRTAEYKRRIQATNTER